MKKDYLKAFIWLLAFPFMAVLVGLCGIYDKVTAKSPWS